MEEKTSEFEAAFAAGLGSVPTPKEFGDVRGRKFVAIPEGFDLHYLDPEPARVHRHRGDHELSDLPSFIEYVKVYGDPAYTRIDCDLDRGRFMAVFNGHEKNNPSGEPGLRRFYRPIPTRRFARVGGVDQ